MRLTAPQGGDGGDGSGTSSSVHFGAAAPVDVDGVATSASATRTTVAPSPSVATLRDSAVQTDGGGPGGGGGEGGHARPASSPLLTRIVRSSEQPARLHRVVGRTATNAPVYQRAVSSMPRDKPRCVDGDGLHA